MSFDLVCTKNDAFCMEESIDWNEKLLRAVNIHNPENVKNALQNGADPNYQFYNSDYCYLQDERIYILDYVYSRVQLFDLEIMELLLMYGADVDVISPRRWKNMEGSLFPVPPLLCHIAENGDIKAADLLIRYGANVNIMDYKGEPPLDYARNSLWPDYKMQKLLIKHGAKVKGENGQLIDAPVRYCREYLEDSLREYKAEIDQKNNSAYLAIPLLLHFFSIGLYTVFMCVSIWLIGFVFSLPLGILYGMLRGFLWLIK